MDTDEVEKINNLLKFGYELGRLPDNIHDGIAFLESSWSNDGKKEYAKDINRFDELFEKYETIVNENYSNIPFAKESLEEARKNLATYKELAKQFA